ncbi:hypothetical protein IJ00_25810 [Calothrix sp. 336/3]|nr:hypothetical protein IJ00_25810 [Calothrix sp. 336/3]
MAPLPAFFDNPNLQPHYCPTKVILGKNLINTYIPNTSTIFPTDASDGSTVKVDIHRKLEKGEQNTAYGF